LEILTFFRKNSPICCWPRYNHATKFYSARNVNSCIKRQTY